jgi:hypothetical protein
MSALCQKRTLSIRLPHQLSREWLRVQRGRKSEPCRAIELISPRLRSSGYRYLSLSRRHDGCNNSSMPSDAAALRSAETESDWCRNGSSRWNQPFARLRVDSDLSPPRKRSGSTMICQWLGMTKARLPGRKVWVRIRFRPPYLPVHNRSSDR